MYSATWVVGGTTRWSRAIFCICVQGVVLRQSELALKTPRPHKPMRRRRPTLILVGVAYRGVAYGLKFNPPPWDSNW